MDLSKPNTNRNLGGNNTISIIPVANVYEIAEPINGTVNSITVLDIDEIYSVKFTEGSANKKVEKDYSKEGIFYDAKLSLNLPKNRFEIRNSLAEIDLSDYIIIITDANGKSEILGEIENAMRLISDEIDTGSNASDFNHYELLFTAKFNFRPYFLTDTFLINLQESSFSLGFSLGFQS